MNPKLNPKLNPNVNPEQIAFSAERRWPGQGTIHLNHKLNPQPNPKLNPNLVLAGRGRGQGTNSSKFSKILQNSPKFSNTSSVVMWRGSRGKSPRQWLRQIFCILRPRTWLCQTCAGEENPQLSPKLTPKPNHVLNPHRIRGSAGHARAQVSAH